LAAFGGNPTNDGQSEKGAGLGQSKQGQHAVPSDERGDSGTSLGANNLEVLAPRKPI
jgi:hypothetical protein